uniref:Tetraspanin n=1 Tax=Glossina brevipalpis TaxID=37001 RepID=A0A1A9W153_9MUSC
MDRDHFDSQTNPSEWKHVVGAAFLGLLITSSRFRKLILFLFILGIGVLLMKPAETSCKNSLKNILLNAINDKHDSSAVNFINYLQTKHQCCGWDGMKDYRNGEIPESCVDPYRRKAYYPGCKSIFD